MEYITAITTFNRQDLVPMVVASVQDKCIVVDTKEFDSLAAAWNKIIKDTIIDGGYESVIIMNDDVQCIGNTAKALHRFRTEIYDPTDTLMVTAYDVNLHGNRGIVSIPVTKELCCMACFCVGKELIQTIGWFDEQFTPAWWEDMDMIIRIRLAQKAIYITVPIFHLGGQTLAVMEDGQEYASRHYTANAERFINKWKDHPRYEEIMASCQARQ